jgi:hypothetical protein
LGHGTDYFTSPPKEGMPRVFFFTSEKNPPKLGFLTCPKVGTWDRLLYFPSEGRHAEDFFFHIRKKIRRSWDF